MNDDPITICQHCYAVKNNNGVYGPDKLIPSIQKLFKIEDKLSHGVCNKCLEKHYPAQHKIIVKNRLKECQHDQREYINK